MSDTEIRPVAESAFALMEVDPEEKESVEALAVKFLAATNWFARKKMFLDLLEEIDMTADVAAELADSPEFAEFLQNAASAMQDAEASLPTEPAKPEGTPDEPGPALPEDAPDDDFLPDDPFAVIAPIYIGAILERLEEPSIVCLEQAAFYFLSTHAEHQEAADTWIAADPKRLRLFRKFCKTHPGYDDAMQRILEDERSGAMDDE